MREKLRGMLIKHERLELKPYRCKSGKITIGVGRNLEDNGISEKEAQFLLNNDMDRCLAEAKGFVWFEKLNENRQIVILSMLFNLGLGTFLEFEKLISALAVDDYAKASNEMLKSLWASQVGKRAVELAAIMKTGVIV